MRASELTNNKLVIFDIDDTLVNTDTKVGVVRDGKTIKKLDSHDFTHYKLEPGEEFDFGAFRDAREFFANARPIAPMIRQLKQDIATGNRVIMVTARADFNDRDIFLSTFEKWGIDMSRVHVYRAGNIQMKVATEEKKKIILRHLLGKTHYDKVIMYDDAVPNLDAFLSLAQDYPWSKFYAWHVDRAGGATEYHRSGTGIKEDSASKGVRAYHGNQGGIDTEQLHAPMWFTASRPDAEHYAGDDGYVVVVDLDIQNPYVLRPGEEANTVLRRWQDLQAQGYDGIYDRRLGDWIPFTRDQIRVISKDDTFMGENTVGGRTATGKQVLKYILKTQGESEFRPFLQKEILAIPQWELVNVPLSSLHIPDLDYDEGEDYEVKADPYGRVLFVDFDYAGEVSAHNIDRLPIVIDSQGHIFDGNHRAWAAAELMNRSTIPAWRPVARTNENFADGKVKGRSRPGRVKRSGASCKGSVTDLRARAKKYGGERGKMYHWCANMKSGRKNK